MAKLNLPLDQIALWLGVPPVGGEQLIDAINTDSRRIESDSLFIAIKGDHFDGHDYVAQAQNAGAIAAVVEKRLALSIPQLVVDDCRNAYGVIASQWHKMCDVVTAVITGSNGKTTVKEMVASILSLNGKVTATQGNLNNEIGVPKTLLSINPADQFAVIEMGANHIGEIKYLTSLVSSDVALVNNAMPSHLEGFGSLDGIVKAKGEIYSGLKRDGVAVINADDPNASHWIDISSDYRQMTFSLDGNADVSGSYQTSDDGIQVVVDFNDDQIKVDIPVLGRHNARNALAAVTIALALNIDSQTIVAGLSQFKPAKGRLNRLPALYGSTLFDDTYNANPSSIKAGIDVLVDVGAKSILVLGDMAELGNESENLHREVAAYAKQSGVDYLFAVGRYATLMTNTFGENGYAFATQESLIESLRLMIDRNTALLIKGSRSSCMEKIVDAITTSENE